MEREITHRCGHPQRHYVGGFYAVDREREAARLARRFCPPCSRRAAAGPSAEAPSGVDLPRLTGSPHQAVWPEAIRQQQQLAVLQCLDPRADP